MHQLKLLSSIVLAVLAGMVVGTTPVRADLRDFLPFGRTHRIAELLPVVVAITTHKTITEPASDQGPPETHVQESYGSGFVIDPSGYIATNKHVIDGADDITVSFQDGTSLPAKLVGVGSHIDLALLKVEPAKPLRAVRWADSSHVHIGDQVLVIGNPLGIGETVSSGIVSALNRDILMGPYDDFIQTDAAINHGNSGGPLFNMRGETIGVNTALVSPSGAGGSVGLGFAIPGNDAQMVLGQLKQFGRTRPGWLGVQTQEVTPDIADALGLTPPHGTIIAGVEKGSPAAEAKLQDGDVILRFGKQAPKDMRALARMAGIATGQTVPLAIWRNGEVLTVPVTITEWVDPPAPPKSKPLAAAAQAVAQPPDLGVHTGPLTDEARTDHKLQPSEPGVLVTGVAPNTAAFDHGVRAGDVITHIQQSPVSTPADVQKQIDAARQDKKGHILLLVLGKDGVRWIALPLS